MPAFAGPFAAAGSMDDSFSTHATMCNFLACQQSATLAELNDFKPTRGRMRTPKAIAKMKRFSGYVSQEVLLKCDASSHRFRQY